MKTLEQIKEEVAIELYNTPWSSIIPYDIDEEIVNKIAKYYAEDYAKEALKNASRGYTPAKIVYNEKTRGYDEVASLESILSESNLPKHR